MRIEIPPFYWYVTCCTVKYGSELRTKTELHHVALTVSDGTSTLKTETAHVSATLIFTYQNICFHNPKDILNQHG